tara:strand:+ start:172 stop:504 length:333 start_codon:yes stop_codon:yes gene_type:complete
VISLFSKFKSKKVGGLIYILGGLFAPSVPKILLDPNLKVNYWGCYFSSAPAASYFVYFGMLCLLHLLGLKIANYFQLFSKKLHIIGHFTLFLLAFFVWTLGMLEFPRGSC